MNNLYQAQPRFFIAFKALISSNSATRADSVPLFALKRLGLGVPCGELPLEDEAMLASDLNEKLLQRFGQFVDCQVYKSK